MINFIVYDICGRILRTGMCCEADIKLQGDLIVTGIADDLMHYVKEGVVLNRPVMPIMQNEETLSNIPLGCSIYIDGALSIENNQKETITVEKEHGSDTYSLRFVLFPYLDFEVTV